MSERPYPEGIAWDEAWRQRRRADRLEAALKRGIELHENGDASTCMCGENMLHYPTDHTPVSMLEYYGDQWAAESRTALENQYDND